MPEVGLGLSAVATGWLLTYLLHSTVLITGAWLVTTVLRVRPATGGLIWKTALVGGLVTATVLVVSSPRRPLIEVMDRVSDEVRLVELTGDPEVGGGLWNEASSGDLVRVRARLVEPSPGCRAALASGVPGSRDWLGRLEDLCTPSGGVRWFHGLLALWLAGGALGLAVLARRHWALSDILSTRGEVLPRTRALLDPLLVGEGGLRVQLGSSDRVGGPCVLAGSTIVLPRRCELELSHAELRAVLAHELAHIARHDFLWLSILRALATLLWIQPMNRMALTKLIESAERSCDELAVTRTGERLGLATSIARVAEWVSSAGTIPGAVSMAGRNGRCLSDRVARILRPKPAGREPGWLPWVVAAALVAPLFWLPAVPAPSTNRSAIFVEASRGDLQLSAQNSFQRVELSEHRVIVARLRAN